MSAATDCYLEALDSNTEEAVVFPELKCSACGDITQQVNCYRCSCFPPKEGSPVESGLFCDVCIGTHIKQKHEVLDLKGYKPEICGTHKMLTSMFCFDCDAFLCLKCQSLHLTHDCRPLSEKAREVKKLVFDFLNQFDELAKPLARQKSFVEDGVAKLEEAYPNLGPATFIDELCKRLERAIRSNSSEWNQIIKSELELLQVEDPIFDLTDKSNSMIHELRGLLAMSDSACVSNLFKKRNILEECLKSEKAELQEFKHVTWSAWSADLESTFQSFLRDLLKIWRVPVVTRTMISNIQCSTTNGKLLYPVDIVCSSQITNTSVSMMCLESGTRTSNDENTGLVLKRHTFPIIGARAAFGHFRTIGLVNAENIVLTHFLDGSYKKVEMSEKLDENLQILAINFWDQFLVWNSSESSVQLIQGDFVLFQIPCEKKPKLAKLSQTIIFVDDQNKVTIIDGESLLEVEVEPQHHGLARVDQICCGSNQLHSYIDACRFTVFLFDYENKIALITKCSFDGVHKKWWIEKVCRLVVAGNINFMTIDQGENRVIIVNSSEDVFIAELLVV